MVSSVGWGSGFKVEFYQKSTDPLLLSFGIPLFVRRIFFSHVSNDDGRFLPAHEEYLPEEEECSQFQLFKLPSEDQKKPLFLTACPREKQREPAFGESGGERGANPAWVSSSRSS
jgi:hypothetical protein